MKNDDVALIRRVLAGDETAFAELVNKYQKSVHTLAWRKIGDFHIAEDITQDTFLKVYQSLHTLKDPNQFSGWLYVITANLCATWLRKKRIQTQPLEDTEITMIQEDAYSQHVTEERGRTAVETQREVVKKLLAKLKESERTVMTLHYLGEMTVAEISRFLGVSVNTIKTRLRRARNRLQKEEPMIREALEHFQITPNLTENIMREVARLKPVAPSGGKPFVPWAVAASTVAVVLLMLGIGNQHLSRFQKPYSFDATSEMTIDIIETPVVLDIESKPDVRTQLGSTAAPSKNGGAGQRPDEVLFAAAQADGGDVSVPKQQWIQADHIKGSAASSLHVTPENELYTFAEGSIYKLKTDGKTWQHIFDVSALNHSGWGDQRPIAKWNSTLYFFPSRELFSSTDDGKTWNLLYSWQEEKKYWNPVELVLTDQAFYLAFDNGIFRSEDTGRTWKLLNDGLAGRIVSLVAVQNTLFVGTDAGFYRLNADSWERLAFPAPIGWIVSVAVAKDRLYVVADLADDLSDPRKISRGQQRAWWIFRSSDLGNSWKDISPTNAWPVNGFVPDIKLIAVGETLLAMERGMIRSTDGGDTWMPPQLPEAAPLMSPINAAAVVNNMIYVGSSNGLYRSTDSGKSWDMVNISAEEERAAVNNLIAFKESNRERNTPATLYSIVSSEVLKSIDSGKSWKNVQIDIPMTIPHRDVPPWITEIIASGGVLYAKGRDSSRAETLIYRVSADGKMLLPIQEMPVFHSRTLMNRLSQTRALPFDLRDKALAEQLQEGSSGAIQFFKQLAEGDPRRSGELTRGGLRGAFAVSDDIFYIEYNYKLFRWKPGETEWYDTEIEETAELSGYRMMEGFKLAASGNTVYVGKRDGHLVVSFDKANNWIDLTPVLPFPVKAFKDIMFVDSTVYVVTDAGVARSSDGKQWRALTDTAGTPLIMEHLAVDGPTLYGITQETGVYRLESGTWKQIISEIPDNVTSLAVDGNTLYVGTESSGMLHFNLER